jgi:hypothetical protein
MYAWAFFEDLHRIYPKRRKKLVIHTGANIKMKNEISDFFDGRYLKVVDDFKSGTKNPVYRSVFIENTKEEKGHEKIIRKVGSFTKRTLLNLLLRSNLIKLCSGSDVLNSLSSMTIWIRGTYYKRGISRNTLSLMIMRLALRNINFSLERNEDKRLVVHYRLNDLLTIGSKSPIERSRISDCIQKSVQEQDIRVVRVLSDSPDVAKERISVDNIELLTENLSNGWDTLKALIAADYFLGTNSKITEWAVIFRLYHDINSPCEIPTSVWEHIKEICPYLEKASNLKTY